MRERVKLWFKYFEVINRIIIKVITVFFKVVRENEIAKERKW